jgi:hypothetical protein
MRILTIAQCVGPLPSLQRSSGHAHSRLSPPCGLGLLAGIPEFIPVAGWMAAAVTILSAGALAHAHWIWMLALSLAHSHGLFHSATCVETGSELVPFLAS